jgi:hypothetical protein
MNLAHALHAILPAEGIKHVFTEAAQGDVSLSYMKAQFPRNALEQAARRFAVRRRTGRSGRRLDRTGRSPPVARTNPSR